MTLAELTDHDLLIVLLFFAAVTLALLLAGRR